jgi:biopolymer transport protein ExbD
MVLLCALLGACGRKDTPPPFPLPQGEHGVAVPEGAFTIDIRANGEVWFEDTLCSLDELSRRLNKRDAVVEQVGLGSEARAQRVLLRVERGVPWGHVEWVRCVLARQAYVHVFLAVEQGGAVRAISARMPRDAAIEWLPGRPRKRRLGVRVQVDADGLCRFGDSTTRDPRELGRWIDASLAEHQGLERIGEVCAAPRAPADVAIRVWDALRAHTFAAINSLPDWIPSQPIRALDRLPDPARSNTAPPRTGASVFADGSPLPEYSSLFDWPDPPEDDDR